MEYYEQMTGEFPSTTILFPNRERDSMRVQRALHIAEFGNPNTRFTSLSGHHIATGYLRVVYGDHGPYVEFHVNNMVRGIWIWRKKGPRAWYDEARLRAAPRELMLYYQKKSVSMLPNPPRGRWSVCNNRPEGYADYRVGRIYASPDQLLVG